MYSALLNNLKIKTAINVHKQLMYRTLCIYPHKPPLREKITDYLNGNSANICHILYYSAERDGGNRYKKKALIFLLI